MTNKVPVLVKNMDKKEAPQINRAITKAYQTRLESIQKRESSGIAPYTYQAVEHGEVNFSANGSPTVVQTFSLSQKYNTIVYAEAHAVSTNIEARVTDITQSQIEITCYPVNVKQPLEAIQTIYEERADQLALSSSMGNSSVPAITHGVEIFSVNITPKEVGNSIIVECFAWGAENSNLGDELVLAAFRNSASSAFAAVTGNKKNIGPALDGDALLLRKEVVVTATNLINFAFRSGMDNGGVGNLNRTRSLNVLNDFGDSSMIHSWVQLTEYQNSSQSNFSQATTATVRVFYQVIGADP